MDTGLYTFSAGVRSASNEWAPACNTLKLFAVGADNPVEGAGPGGTSYGDLARPFNALKLCAVRADNNSARLIVPSQGCRPRISSRAGALHVAVWFYPSSPAVSLLIAPVLMGQSTVVDPTLFCVHTHKLDTTSGTASEPLCTPTAADRLPADVTRLGENCRVDVLWETRPYRSSNLPYNLAPLRILGPD